MEDDISHTDLAIICHSVEGLRGEEMISYLRKANPTLPILRLTLAVTGSRGAYGEVSSLVEGPKSLLDKVGQMLAATGSET
jgi:hypothetical protein